MEENNMEINQQQVTSQVATNLGQKIVQLEVEKAQLQVLYNQVKAENDQFKQEKEGNE